MARNVEANRVFCAECKKWVKLGEGVRYRVKHWAGHCALVHKRDKVTADAIEAEGVANAAKAAASPRPQRTPNSNGAAEPGPSSAPVAPRKLRDHSKKARRKSSSPAAPASASASAPPPPPPPAPPPSQPAPAPPQQVLDRQWQVLTAQNFVAPPQNTYNFPPQSFAPQYAPQPQYTPAPAPAPAPYGFLAGPMLGGQPVFM
ncbi:hypothetical protein AURDEDRAFT_112579, partial [Auricularia subglabra TFB-10046 SS5]